MPWVVVGCALDANGTGPGIGVGPDGSPDIVFPRPDGSDESSFPLQPPDVGPMPMEATTGMLPIADAAEPDATRDAGVDAAVEGGIDAGACVSSDPSCVVVPRGWSIVAFATTRTSACPPAFNQAETDVVEGPNLAGACACNSCNVTVDPDCNQGAIQVSFGPALGSFLPPMCPTAAAALPIDPTGGCSPYPSSGGRGGRMFNDVEYDPPLAIGGACSAMGNPQPNALTYAADERVCASGPAQTAECSGGKACTPQLDPTYIACVMMAGSVTCPANSVFAIVHRVGTTVDFACTDCGCNVTATCSGTLGLFTDGNCQVPAGSPIAVDTTCQPQTTQAPLGGGASYQYTADAPNEQCVATGTSSASRIALVNEATICCAQ